MSTFNLIADRKTMCFSTQLSPFVFQDSIDLVKKMIEEANFITETERKIITEYDLQNQNVNCGKFCIDLLCCLSVIGIPFLCYKNNKRVQNYEIALENIQKKWEDISNRYNEKLIEKGAHVRYACVTKVVRSDDHVYNEYTYYYEFTFKHILDQRLISDLNNFHNIPPATEIQKFIVNNEY